MNDFIDLCLRVFVEKFSGSQTDTIVLTILAIVCFATKTIKYIYVLRVKEKRIEVQLLELRSKLKSQEKKTERDKLIVRTVLRVLGITQKTD